MDGMEFKAQKAEQAIENGLKELQLGRDEVDIEIISNGGLFTKAVVKITPKIKPEQAAADFINNLFSYMRFNAYATLTKNEDENKIDITGEDGALLIGYRGDILDSVQYLALIIANKNTDGFIRISVDTESYREKRKEVLTHLALKLAAKAEKSGRKVEIEPMNPYERRIIHAALQDRETVTTESVGEEPNRYLVIIPKNLKPYDASAGSDRASGDRRGKNGFGGRQPYRGGGNRDGYGGRGGDRGGYNRDGNRFGNKYDKYGNRDRAPRNYNNQAPRANYDKKPDEGVQNGDVLRETTADEIKENDNLDANNGVAGSFKKNGFANMKSFGYKKR
jgi:spoIIIJ-associated protein